MFCKFLKRLMGRSTHQTEEDDRFEKCLKDLDGDDSNIVGSINNLQEQLRLIKEQSAARQKLMRKIKSYKTEELQQICEEAVQKAVRESNGDITGELSFPNLKEAKP
jgi:predicted Holliday junction resolvase-like endonuclease